MTEDKVTPFSTLILVIWMLIVVLSVVLVLSGATTKVNNDYDTMVEASTLAKSCMDAIRSYKIDNDLYLSPYDIFDTGMIGIEDIDKYGSFEYFDYFGDLLCITTTEGILDSKRTSCDPNWAGLVVSMFKRAGLKSGDEIGVIFSGSFPAMNISVLCAAKVCGLKVCSMSGIGASNYGANDPRFTFVEMVEYLVSEGLLDNKIDYISWGGEDDILLGLMEQYEESSYIKRIETEVINAYGDNFIYESNFAKNVAKRVDCYAKDVPNMKMFINVGGTMLGLGTGLNVFEKSGYVSAGVYSTSSGSSIATLDENSGLLQYYHMKGLPVVNFLNFKGLSKTYGIPYVTDSSVSKPQIGLTEYNTSKNYYNFYYSTSYNTLLIVFALVLSVVIAVFYFIYKKNKSIRRNTNERNYILCGR